MVVKISLIIPHPDGKVARQLENVFIASVKPPYLGVICSPADPSWQTLQSMKKVLVSSDGRESPFIIEYRIDVGENTIFFLKPEDPTFPVLNA
ncbi:MAG: hypothetical protein ACYDAZ_03605 [Thermoplasmataceae archaeon]